MDSSSRLGRRCVFLSVSFMFISYKQLNRSEGMGVYFSCIFDLNDLLYKFTFNFFALCIGGGFELRSVFCSIAQPQGSHPGSKKCKFLTPGALLMVKRIQQMIKSPYHGQTCNVKSLSYAPPPPPSGLTLIGALAPYM